MIISDTTALLTQKVFIDHATMGSTPIWKQDILTNSFLKKNLYVNRLKCVIFNLEICILQTRTYWKVATPWD